MRNAKKGCEGVQSTKRKSQDVFGYWIGSHCGFKVRRGALPRLDADYLAAGSNVCVSQEIYCASMLPALHLESMLSALTAAYVVLKWMTELNAVGCLPAIEAARTNRVVASPPAYPLG